MKQYLLSPLLYTTLVGSTLTKEPLDLSAGGCIMTTRQRNLLGITDFEPRSFNFFGKPSTSLVYGTLENESIVSQSAVFYQTITECQPRNATSLQDWNKQRQASINSFSLRPMGDWTLLVSHDGLLQEH